MTNNKEKARTIHLHVLIPVDLKAKLKHQVIEENRTKKMTLKTLITEILTEGLERRKQKFLEEIQKEEKG